MSKQWTNEDGETLTIWTRPGRVFLTTRVALVKGRSTTQTMDVSFEQAREIAGVLARATQEPK